MTHAISDLIRRSAAAWVPLLCLLGGGALLGVSTNLAKLAGQLGLPPLAYLCWSIMGAAVLLTLTMLARGIVPPLNRRAIEYYVCAALVGVAGPNLIFFTAVSHVGAGFVALVITLPPLLTYLGALAFRLEHYQTSRAVGVGAALAGTLVLAVGRWLTAYDELWWIVLALAGPLLLAVGNLYRTLRWPWGASAQALAPGMLSAAAIMLLLTGALPGLSLSVTLAGHQGLLLIGLQALVFGGQFLLLFVLQKTGGPVLLSLLGCVGAVVGVPIAVGVLGEAPPAGLWPGAILIAIGIVLVSLGRRHSANTPHPTHAQGELQ